MDAPLPDPLNTPDCDVRHREDMPLQMEKVNSFAKTVSPAGLMAALKVWWTAWREVPAGSLPSDDETLRQLVGVVPAPGWEQLKHEALTGFVLCNDGRYYHPFITKLARAVLEDTLSYEEGFDQ